MNPGSMMRDLTETPTLTSASFEELAREMLVRMGEQPDREGLLKTPERFSQALQYFTKGYGEDPEQILKAALFSVDYDEMVFVKDIEMFSLCEHHVLPFFGKVHVAYIPKGKVLGLSNVPRMVEASARTNCGDVSESHSAIRCRSSHRGPPSLHDDARGREATFGHGHLVHARCFPSATNPPGVSVPDPRQEWQRNLSHDCEEAAVQKQNQN